MSKCNKRPLTTANELNDRKRPLFKYISLFLKRKRKQKKGRKESNIKKRSKEKKRIKKKHSKRAYYVCFVNAFAIDAEWPFF